MADAVGAGVALVEPGHCWDVTVVESTAPLAHTRPSVLCSAQNVAGPAVTVVEAVMAPPERSLLAAHVCNTVVVSDCRDTRRTLGRRVLRAAVI